RVSHPSRRAGAVVRVILLARPLARGPAVVRRATGRARPLGDLLHGILADVVDIEGAAARFEGEAKGITQPIGDDLLAWPASGGHSGRVAAAPGAGRTCVGIASRDATVGADAQDLAGQLIESAS